MRPRATAAGRRPRPVAAIGAWAAASARRRGFTLLELLVVLALLALVAGLVFPALQRALQAAEVRGWRADLAHELRALPVRAFIAGRPLEVDAAALQATIDGLGEGWRVAVDAPLRYGPQGLAGGGRVRLLDGDRVDTVWSVRPVTGDVTLVGDTP